MTSWAGARELSLHPDHPLAAASTKDLSDFAGEPPAVGFQVERGIGQLPRRERPAGAEDPGLPTAVHSVVIP